MRSIISTWRFLALGGCVLLVVACLLLADRLQAENNNEGDLCIGCHVEQYNEGIASPVQHPPFWDRQCTACHLAPGSSWPGESSSAQDINGLLVTQDLIWGKILPVSDTLLGRDHSASLTTLNSSAGYRFRLLIGQQPGTAEAKGLWIGLDPRKLWKTGSHELTTSSGLEGAIGTHIGSLTMTALSNDQVLVSWQTDPQLYSWLELQDMQGVKQTQSSVDAGESGQGAHPPLRRMDDLAINACYQCHPESSLGTSHPVRLYGGRDVQIPDDLPTADGMLTCVTCHNPHGSASKMLVRTKIKTQLCVTCHYKFKNSSLSTMFD